MNKKILLPIIFGVISIIILVTVLATINQKTIMPIEKSITETSIMSSAQMMIFSYVDSNSILKSTLASKGISMSSPMKLSGDSLKTYCTFFANTEKQNLIQYCTSTELKDSNGKFLGNIHLVGSANFPSTVLGIIQTDQYMSNLDSIKVTYQIMVESLVCNCWQDQKPGNLESVDAWIDATKSHHSESKHVTSSSKINGLAKKQLLLEVTTNTEGYLWKFIITN